MNSSAARANAVFQQNIHNAAPHLFNLADELITAAPSAPWDVLICDDIGARLPFFFTRRVLQNAGYEYPCFFVAGSLKKRKNLGPNKYTKYFQGIADSLGQEVINPLLFTESTATGGALRFLIDAISPLSGEVETAAIVNKYPDEMSTTYAGFKGADAANDILYCFENIQSSDAIKGLRRLGSRIPSSIRQFVPERMKGKGRDFGFDLLGLGIDDSPLPIASLVNRDVGISRSAAYETMSNLAIFYTESRR